MLFFSLCFLICYWLWNYCNYRYCWREVYCYRFYDYSSKYILVVFEFLIFILEKLMIFFVIWICLNVMCVEYCIVYMV